MDIFPAAFLLLAVLSIFLESDAGVSWVKPIDDLYRGVGIGVIAYYFCALGPVGPAPWTRLTGALLSSSIVVSGMALLEKVTGWTLWGLGNSDWHTGVFRVVGPFGNPDVLGTFLGAAIVLATAIVIWNGPRRLRLVSLATLVIAPPAVFLTYTRAPIIATGLAVVVLLASRPRIRIVAAGVLVVAATLLAAEWGSISQTSVYQQRAADAQNIYGRELLASWSLQLASKHPLIGSGYDSFDRVKNAAGLSSGGIDASGGLAYTSHDTFLTVLVELGGLGLVLLLWPFLRVMLASLRRAYRDPPRRWLFAGWLGVVAVYFFNAATIDMRFFSFVAALPWIALGLLRRALDTADATE
jgi:hypothetical protein